MTNTTLASIVVALTLAASPLTATAAVPPASVEDCLKQLEALVTKAHALDLLDDQIDIAEVELGRMESHCIAKDFADARAAADEVEKILATNK